jgi:hypothetical protein
LSHVGIILWKGASFQSPQLSACLDRPEGRTLLIGMCLAAVVSASVLALRASAGFITAASYAVGPSPQSVVVADFNGDGKLNDRA